MGSGVTITGAGDLLTRLRSIRRRVRRAADEAPRAAAEQTLRRALDLVPRRTGNLASSGRVEQRPGGAAVVFGDARAPYAFVVHQSPDLIHTSGQWQFLTSALDDDDLLSAVRRVE